jgi:hypothetical protein
VLAGEQEVRRIALKLGGNDVEVGGERSQLAMA